MAEATGVRINPRNAEKLEKSKPLKLMIHCVLVVDFVIFIIYFGFQMKKIGNLLEEAKLTNYTETDEKPDPSRSAYNIIGIEGVSLIGRIILAILLCLSMSKKMNLNNVDASILCANIGWELAISTAVIIILDHLADLSLYFRWMSTTDRTIHFLVIIYYISFSTIIIVFVRRLVKLLNTFDRRVRLTPSFHEEFTPQQPLLELKPSVNSPPSGGGDQTQAPE